MRKRALAITKAGWSVDEFTQACGVGRNAYWDLPPEQRPKSVRLSERRLIIIERPEDWLARMATEAAA
jgi:hypothetical protein